MLHRPLYVCEIVVWNTGYKKLRDKLLRGNVHAIYLQLVSQAVIQILSSVTGPVELVRPLRPWWDEMSSYLWSKSCIFKVLIAPIIVKSRFFSNGRTTFSAAPVSDGALYYRLATSLFSRKSLQVKYRLKEISYERNGSWWENRLITLGSEAETSRKCN